MRNPPYFARMRRSSSRQPSAKPIPSETIEHPSAHSQVGREGIIEFSGKRGGAPGLVGSVAGLGDRGVSTAEAAGDGATGAGAAGALAVGGLRTAAAAAALTAFFA